MTGTPHLVTLIESVADAVMAGAPKEAVLARIEVVRSGLRTEADGSPPSNGGTREVALRTISALGGNVSPLTLGHALDPGLTTFEAGNLGAGHLQALVRHGLVVKTGHARYTLTTAGLAELHRLGCALAPVSRQFAAVRQRTALDRVLLTFAGLDHWGCTAMQLGVALTGGEPNRATRSNGSVRLTALKQAGFVARSRPNWWELTATGRARVARLHAEGSAPPVEATPVEPAAALPDTGDRRISDLGPALIAMARMGSVKSSGDLGRALDPRRTAERACSLGRTRLIQLQGRGWVVRHELGGWSITEEGRMAAVGEVAA